MTTTDRPGAGSAPTAAPAAGQGVEQHSVDFIPESERHGGTRQQSFFWFVANFNVFAVTLGFIGPALGLSLWWTVAAGAGGALFGASFVSFHASQGPQLGLPQMIQSRAQFGYRGVLVPVIASLFNFLVFNILQADVLESGLSGIFGWTPFVVVIAVSLFAAVVAIYGHDWVHRVFRAIFWVSLPFYVVLTAAIALGGVEKTSSSSSAGFSLTAFMAVFVTAAVYNLTLAPYVSDYTRYLPKTVKTSHVVIAVQGGISLSLVWLMAIGAWLSLNTGATDGLVGLSEAGNQIFTGFGTVLALVSAAGLIGTMSINTYSAVLAIATVADCVRPVTPTRRLRIRCTAILFVIWVPVTIWVGSDQATLITNLLSVLLYLLVPWTAVNLVDYFFVRKGHYAITEISQRNGIYGEWAWRGLTAYFVGLFAQVPFMVLSFYQGPAAQLFDNIDVAFVVGLLVSAGVFLLLNRGVERSQEERAVALSEDALRGE